MKESRKEHASMVAILGLITPVIVFLATKSILLSIVSFPITIFGGILHGLYLGLFDEDE